MRHARKCYNCGKIYSYCPNCSDDRNKPVWMATFHDESCKTAFETCVRFNMNLVSKDEAKKLLSACDLSNKSAFREDVQRDIKTIFTEDKRQTDAKSEVKPMAAKPVAPKAAEIKPEV